MKISLNDQAELELVEGAAYYARVANADIANAFISEFERSAKLLGEFPKLGSIWRGRIVACRCVGSLTASCTTNEIRRSAFLRSLTNGAGPGSGEDAREP